LSGMCFQATNPPFQAPDGLRPERQVRILAARPCGRFCGWVARETHLSLAPGILPARRLQAEVRNDGWPS
jgi:hypothetical protein